MKSRAQQTQRIKAINSVLTVLDDSLFKALQEPSRVAVLRQLMVLGRADVGQIAAALPQERSVISRHLQLLLDAGIVRMERAGRHRFYQLDGPAIVSKFEVILHEMRQLAPWCCPVPLSTQT